MAATTLNPKNNPAEEGMELELPANYRPMSVGQRRLEVTEITGWHLHWFRGTPGNLARAKQAGYVHVEKGEVDINDMDLAGGDSDEGNGLGSYVSVISGDDASGKGQPGQLFLMKCPESLWRYAQGLHMNEVHGTAAALRGGMIGADESGETRDDAEKRYLSKRTKVPKLFTPRKVK